MMIKTENTAVDRFLEDCLLITLSIGAKNSIPIEWFKTRANKFVLEFMKKLGCDYCEYTGYIKLYAQLATGDTRPLLMNFPCPRCFDGFWPEGTTHQLGFAKKYTTIKELIEQLQKFPSERIIKIDIEDGGNSVGIEVYETGGTVWLGNKDGTPPET